MISKNVLKEIILANEDFIVKQVGNPVKRECDFIAKASDGALLPIQVCFELNEENMSRETDGLIKACKAIDASKGLILTNDDEKELSKEGINIKAIPFWKWCLSQGR